MLSVKNYVKLFSLTIFFISVSCNKEVTEPESVPPGLLSFAWEQTGGPSFGPVSAVVSRPGDLLAASKNNLLRTTDGGKTWKKILSILGEITGLVAENNMILVSTSWDDPGKKIYRSIDNGNTWNTVGPTVKTIRTIKLLNGNIYFIVAGGGLFSSNSDFSSYTRILEEQALIKDVTITPQGDLLVSGGSLLKSTDNGSTWTAIEGYTHAMAVSKDGYIFASYSNQISYSKDGGNTWEIFIDNVGSREVRYLYSQGDYLYMALEDLGFYRSPINTPSLTKISQFDMAKFNEDSQSYAIAGTNEGDLYLGCYPYGLFISKDNGNSLKQIGLPTSAVSMMVSDKYNNLYTVSGITPGNFHQLLTTGQASIIPSFLHKQEYIR